MVRLQTLLLVLALAVSSACERKQRVARSPEGPAPTTSEDEIPPDSPDILLGIVASLTGSEATFGQSSNNGMYLAADQINENGGVRGGKRIRFRVYDDQGKPEEAANATLRLITQDRVRVILGEVASTNSLAMAEKAQLYKVPMVTPSSTDPAITQKGDYIFRVCFNTPFQGFVAAKFARENLKLNRVAILKDNRNAYSIGLANVFESKFSEMGGTLVAVESYTKGDTDFRAQLSALKGIHPEGIFIPGNYTEVGLIARQARQLNIQAVLFGGDAWESPRLFELGGEALEGSYYVNHYSPDAPNPATQKFIAAYKAKYGEVPGSLAAMGYDALMVVAQALDRAKDLSHRSIREALTHTKNYPGAAGTITLDSNRNAIKAAVVLKVENGKAVYSTTVEP